MKTILAEKNPYPFDPLALIILIPMLIVYWCPTAAIIYLSFIQDSFPKGNVIMIIWGGVATWIIMHSMLCIIRDIIWKHTLTSHKNVIRCTHEK